MGVMDFIDRLPIFLSSSDEQKDTSISNAQLPRPTADLVDRDFSMKNLSKRPPAHKPLLERLTCHSYDEKIRNMPEKKRKLMKSVHGWDLA